MPLLLTFIFFLIGLNMTRASSDEIDAWARSFHLENLNGLTPAFNLPEDTSTEKVVEALAKLESKSDSTGQFHNYRILETKQILEPGAPLYDYTVVLIASDKGSKTMIVLDCPTRNPGEKIVVVDKSATQFSVWYAHPFYITTVP